MPKAGVKLGLVLKTQKALSEARAFQFGFLRQWPTQYLDVRVTKGSVKRALLVMDSLIKTLEARGLTVFGGDLGSKKTRVVVLDENISFFLREKVKRQDHIPTEKEKGRGILGWNQYDYIPTGNLVLGVDVWLTGNFRKTWADGSSQRVENMLNDFVVGVIKIADIKRQSRLKREERERQRFEEQKRQEELERHRLAEAKRRCELENQADRWNQSKQLRAYIKEVQMRANKEALSTDSQIKLEEWFSWATEHADRLDPLKAGLPFETTSTENNNGKNDST